MGWLMLFVLICGATALYLRSSSKKQKPLRPIPRPPLRLIHPASRPRPATDEAHIRSETKAEAARMREAETHAARMKLENKAEAIGIETEAMREAAAVAFDADDSEPVNVPLCVVWREDYVAKEVEGRYLSRRDDGLPNLYLADAADRLAIWSPLDGGALINPKGAGRPPPRAVLVVCARSCPSPGRLSSR